MLASKKTTLKPLLESNDGLHLTAYLVNRGDFNDLKAQLCQTITQAHEWLHTVMPADGRNKFLEPLEKLLTDTRIFKHMKGNIGIFRNQDSFRILNIPIDVEQTCQVATSFHVKPLLRWLQNDVDFLLLILTSESAHLYLGSHESLRLIDGILLPDFLKENEAPQGHFLLKDTWEKKAKAEETLSWLNEQVPKLTKNLKPTLFITGENSIVEGINFRRLNYKNTVVKSLPEAFTQKHISEICQSIRKILKAESQQTIEKTLREFRFAEKGNRTHKNIFHIAKAVVQGKVKKLIVTDELSIFGKIDLKSGGLALHPFDLDHEDDDILDDLAQMVLSQGGEVIVAAREDIPKGRPILAILDDEAEDLEKTEELNQYEDLQERFG